LRKNNEGLPFHLILRPTKQWVVSMKNGDQSDRKNNQTSRLVPDYRELTWVQCKGYRCLAYTDATGKWINFYTGKKVTDFVKIIR
jgi:hypothetical protein